MDCGCSGDDCVAIAEIPVLEPPPGFEDCSFVNLEERFYDDPYSDEEDIGSQRNLKPVLELNTVLNFASELAHSLLSLVVKPKVKLRIKKHASSAFSSLPQDCEVYSLPVDSVMNSDECQTKQQARMKNRHSIAVARVESSEPVHMSLEEVRSYLREFQDTSSRRRPWMVVPSKSVESPTPESKRKSCFVWTPNVVSKNSFDDLRTKRSRKTLSVTAAGIKQALFSVFRIPSYHHLTHHGNDSLNQVCPTGWTFSAPEKSGTLQHASESSPHQRRALPPVPHEDEVGFVRVPSRPYPALPTLIESHECQKHHDLMDQLMNATSSSCLETSVDCVSTCNNRQKTDKTKLDFAASIEAVKDHGWYWGPLSGDAAEQILYNEPDGSFLVRDSSDDHYIFSLSFKLNGGVRHVRIEHDHGNFSFGSVARFKSQTMVEFIDKAIEHSRSGRFLFFLHRRPTHGPTRVQLLHPVSRFRQVQSLQHLSRFVILKLIRRDQINMLPLPKRLRNYLNTTHYYSEQSQESLHHSP